MTPKQCKAARALLGMSQNELLSLASITGKTLSDYESGKTRPYSRTLDAIREALEAAGVEFIAENGGGAGVRLRKPTESPE